MGSGNFIRYSLGRFGTFPADSERFQFEDVNLTDVYSKTGTFPMSLLRQKPFHIDVEAGFQSSKSTIAETGMGVTSRP